MPPPPCCAWSPSPVSRGRIDYLEYHADVLEVPHSPSRRYRHASSPASRGRGTARRAVEGAMRLLVSRRSARFRQAHQHEHGVSRQTAPQRLFRRGDLLFPQIGPERLAGFFDAEMVLQGTDDGDAVARDAIGPGPRRECGVRHVVPGRIVLGIEHHCRGEDVVSADQPQRAPAGCVMPSRGHGEGGFF